MRSQLKIQAKLVDLEEPDDTGVLDRISLFLPDGSPLLPALSGGGGAGPPGDPGPQGDPGVDGTDGAPGADGAEGPQGPAVDLDDIVPWTAITSFGTGVTAADPGYGWGVPSARCNVLGTIELQGMLVDGPGRAAAETLFTLPVGCRPPKVRTAKFITTDGGTYSICIVNIFPTGIVSPVAAIAALRFVGLDNTTFPT